MFCASVLAHTGQFAPVNQQYRHFKTERIPWLSDVPSSIVRNGAVLWKQACRQYFSQLGARPMRHKKHGKQAVWLTSEVFEFTPVVNTETGAITAPRLHIGTRKFPVGVMLFNTHKDYKVAASLHISIHAGRWQVSFNDHDNAIAPSDKDTVAWLGQFEAQALRAMTVGPGRGVALPLAGSDQQPFDFSPVQTVRLAAQDRHKKRWQKRQARRTPGSARWIKAKRKVGRYQRYGADVRRGVSHKTRHALAVDPRYSAGFRRLAVGDFISSHADQRCPASTGNAGASCRQSWHAFQTKLTARLPQAQISQLFHAASIGKNHAVRIVPGAPSLPFQNQGEGRNTPGTFVSPCARTRFPGANRMNR